MNSCPAMGGVGERTPNPPSAVRQVLPSQDFRGLRVSEVHERLRGVPPKARGHSPQFDGGPAERGKMGDIDERH